MIASSIANSPKLIDIEIYTQEKIVQASEVIHLLLLQLCFVYGQELTTLITQTVTLRYTRGFWYISIYMRARICEIIRTGDLKQAFAGR